MFPKTCVTCKNPIHHLRKPKRILLIYLCSLSLHSHFTTSELRDTSLHKTQKLRLRPDFTKLVISSSQPKKGTNLINLRITSTQGSTLNPKLLEKIQENLGHKNFQDHCLVIKSFCLSLISNSSYACQSTTNIRSTSMSIRDKLSKTASAITKKKKKKKKQF